MWAPSSGPPCRPDPGRELLAQALVNKGVALGERGRPAEAVAVYDQVVDRYGADPAPAMRELLAWAVSARQETQDRAD